MPALLTASMMRSASAREEAMGFSQRMPLTPASAPSMQIWAWTLSPVTTLRMSRFSFSSISTWLV